MSIYRSVSISLFAAGLGTALAFGPALGAEPTSAAGSPDQPTVVFMCKYGSVKSLVASETFNRLAEQRGLSVRSIGRAANPGTLHTDVPGVVERSLDHEGINVSNYKPQVISPEEAASATRVVHISLQGEPDPDSTVITKASHVAEERWDDVPTMLIGPDGKVDETGAQYNKAHSQMIRHINAMVEEYAKKTNTAAAK
jgi:protein-tyrosine-phosphatase